MNNIQLKDAAGDLLYPITKPTNVQFDDGKNLNQKLNEMSTKTEEALLQAVNGKTKIATAINGKGVAATSNDSFDVLSNKISTIKTGGKSSEGNFTKAATLYDGNTFVVPYSLDFVPSKIFAIFGRVDLYSTSSVKYTVGLDCITSNKQSVVLWDSTGNHGCDISITNITKTSFTVKITMYDAGKITFSSNHKWYAFE